MANKTPFIYKFIQDEFSCNGERFNVVLTPELYAEEDGLDFTGNYTGILIGENTGSLPFQLTAIEEGKWQMDLLSQANEEYKRDPEIDLTSETKEGELIELSSGNTGAQSETLQTPNDAIVAVNEGGKIVQFPAPRKGSPFDEIVEKFSIIIDKYRNGKL